MGGPLPLDYLAHFPRNRRLPSCGLGGSLRWNPQAMTDEMILDTTFTRILQGEAPATFVYRDDRVSAFLDIQPVNPGHVLVVPNEPVRSLAELDEDTGAHLFKVAMRIAEAIRKTSLRCEGVNLFLADGESAGQEVFHVHLHVIPRFKGDGFGLRFPQGYSDPRAREELEEVGMKIRDCLPGG